MDAGRWFSNDRPCLVTLAPPAPTAASFTSDSGAILTDPDELVRVIDEATASFVERSVARALADNAARSIQWLQSFGTKFVPLEPVDGWKDHVLPPLGFHNKTTMEWEGMGADRLIDRLEQRIKELGGDSIRGARMTGLIMEDGAVRGVNVETRDGPKSYRAKAVVLADGGFEGNKDMLRRFIAPHPENLHMRAPDSGNGDGMRLAEEAGGMLVEHGSLLRPHPQRRLLCIEKG